MLVCGGRLGRRVPTSGGVVVPRVPTSGGLAGPHAPTSGKCAMQCVFLNTSLAENPPGEPVCCRGCGIGCQARLRWLSRWWTIAAGASKKTHSNQRHKTFSARAHALMRGGGAVRGQIF